jgi:ribose 1,5-bisphosphate isomerase
MGFKEVCRDIKSLKIQGAENVAIRGIKALSMQNADVKTLLSLRPTEPMLRNAVKFYKENGEEKTLEHFESSMKKLVRYGVRKVRPVVFTHCHSSSVVNILKEAKKTKKFEVYNTETRPLFQGRKTSKELSKIGVKVTEVVDSAGGIALRRTRFMKKSDVMMIGADAVLKDGRVINKVGSGLFAEIAYYHKIPVYICSDSWKFSNRSVKIEERSFKEVWEKKPRGVKIKNPAFEVVESKYITGIISELGVLNPKKFVKKVQKVYKWI